jgi:hypothetical protein
MNSQEARRAAYVYLTPLPSAFIMIHMSEFNIVPSHKKSAASVLAAASLSVPLFLTCCIGMPAYDFNITCIDQETRAAIPNLKVLYDEFHGEYGGGCEERTDINGSVNIFSLSYTVDVTITDDDSSEGIYNPVTLKANCDTTVYMTKTESAE